MKMTLLLLLSLNLFSHEIIGKLINFDDAVIGECLVKGFRSNEKFAKVSYISYLDRKYENVYFKAFSKNGIGGQFYYSEDIKGMLLNTNNRSNLVQINLAGEDIFLTCIF